MSLEYSVAAAFDLGGTVVDVKPLGRGLINDTFLVTTDNGYAVLQRINRRAFPRPELVMQNLRRLSDHIATRDDAACLRLPRIVPARDGKDFVLDERDGFWRTITYIENTDTFDTVTSMQQASEIGAALGRFHALADGLDPAGLHATRPGFHQTPLYYARFDEAARRTGATPSDADMNWCIGFARARSNIVSVLEDARQRGELKLRVIHGDTKLDNFLFDTTSGRAVSLIDLDTVQPGLVHYDVGDCIRSAANPVGESPPDAEQARFDLGICEAVLSSYLAQARSVLSPSDIAHLYDAIRLIPFELGLRFLTDHLEGDVYFKTQWRGHNLHRARVQFRLTADIEKNETSIRALVTASAG
ncbi:MAG TPA: phosphotransferase [Burkholderiales bacterium]|nr:phosphotransferase [Burkholderiales bacterium]